MKQSRVQSPLTDEQNPSTHQQQPQINIPAASNANSGPPPTPSQSQLPPNTRRLKPNLPNRVLLTGPRGKYLQTGVPLYEASIKCDWKAAKEIIDNNPELVRCSITENGETALHVAASAKGPKHVEEFVKNLVDMMKVEDLTLENENFNTAMYLAVVAGNIETVKVMVKKNRTLLKIPGAEQQMMPLYAAALFGHYKVVKFLYENSKGLCDEDGWTTQSRGWLLEKCAENDMFDVALEIVKKYPKLSNGNVLGVLAQKPEAFREAKSNFVGRTIKLGKHIYSLMFTANQPSQNKHPEPGSGSVPDDVDLKPEALTETKSNIVRRTIKSGKRMYSLMFNTDQPSQNKHESGPSQNKHAEPGSRSAPEYLDRKPETLTEMESNIIRRTIKSVSELIGSKLGAPEKENKALPFLTFVWDSIAKRPKREIDNILRGPPDSYKQDKSASGRLVQAIQLQKIISEHLRKLEIESKSMIKEQPDSTMQDNKPAFTKVDQALQLKNLISEYLVNLHIETQKVISKDDTPVSGKRDPALELQKLISEHIVNMHDETQNIFKQGSGKEDQSPHLQKLITRHITRMRTATTTKESHSSRILFIAAEMGNTRFLVELIRRYPDLIWKVNDNNQTIFHIAVQHRHEGIYNLLYEIGTMKDLITPLRDPNDNNMLHLVGKIVKQRRLEDVSGVALQMQRELLWFQEVKNMIPPSYRERKNEDGLTPHELFTLEHKELVTQGESWMKETANQCMVVAALIATIVFAAAFTVPGGYDQNSGIPMFKSEATFMVFVVADAISLFSSSASILIFLSILTSRYAERDFLESLPKKLMSGLVTLFLSISTMTVVFGVSFFVLYNKGLLWVPVLICVFGVLPVLLYIKLQYALFIDVISSTYASRYLFKPKKHVLYYENPKV